MTSVSISPIITSTPVVTFASPIAMSAPDISQPPTLNQSIKDVRKNMQSLNRNLSKEISNLKTIKKSARNLLLSFCKVARSAKEKSHEPSIPKLSGFLKPVPLSSDLSNFCNWPVGEMHSRVEVTKKICEYIKANRLQTNADKRIIVPDERLTTLLQYNVWNKSMMDHEKLRPLTFATLQICLKPLFL